MALRTGQTEAVSLVIISGVVITLVCAAYFWGMPLIDKRAASTDFESAKNSIMDINKKVVALANAGGGKVDIQLQKALTLIPADSTDTDNNTIMLTYGVNQPVLYSGPEDSVIYLGTTIGDALQGTGVFGQSSPGVITMKQTATMSSTYLLTTRLRFRPLTAVATTESGSVSKNYLIKLCRDDDLAGCSRQATGTSGVTFTFRGTEVTQGGNIDTVVTKIGVKMT